MTDAKLHATPVPSGMPKYLGAGTYLPHPAMRIKNPQYREDIARIFESAGHIQALGIHLTDVGPGWCETHLNVGPHHLQQTNLVHAGVLATLADHTAGAAGSTLLAPDEYVLTVISHRFFTDDY